MEIPDYYSQLARKESQPPPARKPLIDTANVFRGNSFSIAMLKDWQDKTVYTLTGPVEDGIQHNVTITIDSAVSFDNIEDYARWQIAAIEQELRGCRLLKQGGKKLANGTPAFESVFRWYPTEELQLYQQQIYVLLSQTGFRLTASFTKKTRKTLGRQIESMMLSFQPT